MPRARQRRGRELEQDLLLLEAKYPDFARLIQLATEAVHLENKRTPESDRSLVVHAIEIGNNVVDDICDETRLTRWAVQVILDELVGLRILEVRTGPVMRDIQKARVLYVFRHARP